MRTKELLVACFLFAKWNIAFSQNVAINTSGAAAASTNMLEVAQTSTAANMVAIYAIHSGAAAGTGYGLYATKTGASTTNIAGYFSASGGTSNYPGIFMGGNVGIGTIAPNRKLEILSGSSDGITFGQEADNTQTIQTYIDGQWTNRATYAGGCCNALAIQPDVGTVGIGTTAPTQKLDVRGNIAQPNDASLHIFPEISGNTSYHGLMDNNGFFADGVPWYGGVGREPGAWVYPYPDMVISNHTGIRLDAHSNYGGISFYEQLNAAGTTWSSTGNEIARFRDDRWGSSYIMTSVGIGTTTPACKLQVIGRIMTDNMNQTSDMRLKKNIVTIDNALSKIQSVRGVYFNWRNDVIANRNFDTTLQMGVIAQEIEKVFPQLVLTDNAGYKSVEYSNMVAVLIEAIKEQQRQIERLEVKTMEVIEENKKLGSEMELIKTRQGIKVDNQSGKIEIKPPGK